MPNIADHAVEQAISTATLKATGPAGLATGAMGYFTFNEWLGILGFLVAAVSYGIAIVVAIRKDAREEREHAANMEAIEARKAMYLAEHDSGVEL